MENKVDCHHDKDFWYSECWLYKTELDQNLSTQRYCSKVYPLTKENEDLKQKIRKDVIGGPSISFMRKFIIDGSFIRKSKELMQT